MLCPVCGIVYGGARLAIDLAGYDVADAIDSSSLGPNYGAGTVWNYLTED